MDTNKKLRVGVIGLGPIAQVEWLPYLHELDEYEIVAISDTSNRLLEYFGNLYGVRNRYPDKIDMLDCPEVEAVIVLNQDHTELCIEAAKRKKHIIVEKPLCENPAQAKRIVDAVEKNGITFMVGEMKRYDSGYNYAIKMIKEMKGLKMIRVRDYCDMLFSSLPEILVTKRRIDVPQSKKDEDYSKVEASMKEVTGEIPVSYYLCMLLAGVHDIEIMRAAFGDPRGVQYCEIWDNGNAVLAVLDYGDNIKATFEVGFTKQKWFEEELIAYGEEQTIKVKFPHPYIKNCPTTVEVIENNNGAVVEKKISASFDEAFRNELKHFYECVTQNKLPYTNVYEGKKDIDLIADIFECYKRRVLNGK